GCSTPSGVTEGITCGGRRGQHRLIVLNAFRRHGRNHPATDVMPKCPKWCSTPSGVTEGITKYGRVSSPPSPCAQRLPASRKESLNSPKTTPKNWWSAQRLPASRKESRGDRFPSALTVAGCSTPSGVTEGITRQHRLHALQPDVLNAFRRH